MTVVESDVDTTHWFFSDSSSHPGPVWCCLLLPKTSLMTLRHFTSAMCDFPRKNTEKNRTQNFNDWFIQMTLRCDDEFSLLRMLFVFFYKFSCVHFSPHRRRRPISSSPHIYATRGAHYFSDMSRGDKRFLWLFHDISPIWSIWRWIYWKIITQ